MGVNLDFTESFDGKELWARGYEFGFRAGWDARGEVGEVNGSATATADRGGCFCDLRIAVSDCE